LSSFALKPAGYAGVLSSALFDQPALVLLALFVLSLIRSIFSAPLGKIKEVIPMVNNATKLVVRESLDSFWAFSISVGAGLALLT